MIHFQFDALMIKNVKFEQNPRFNESVQNVKCKLLAFLEGFHSIEIISLFLDVTLKGNKETKQAFVFEYEHYINYFKAFTNAEIIFEIHHTISDADMNALNYLEHSYFPKLSMASMNSRVDLTYYSNDSLQTVRYLRGVKTKSNIKFQSKMYKKLHKLACCVSCPYSIPRHSDCDGNLQFFIRYDFSKRYEHIASRWNPRFVKLRLTKIRC